MSPSLVMAPDLESGITLVRIQPHRPTMLLWRNWCARSAEDGEDAVRFCGEAPLAYSSTGRAAAFEAAGNRFLGVSVYNRWGNEVFNSQDLQFRWDATAWSSDTYHYYIRYRTPSGEHKIQKGSVLVVR